MEISSKSGKIFYENIYINLVVSHKILMQNFLKLDSLIFFR